MNWTWGRSGEVLALEYQAPADRGGHLDRLAEDLGLSTEWQPKHGEAPKRRLR